MASSRLFVLTCVLIALVVCSSDRIQSQDYAFKLQVVGQVNGLRVQTDVPGGQVASFASNGNFHVDAPFVPGGRFAVRETGEVGIGTASPSSQLHVRVPASASPISAMTVDVDSFSTSGNAQASHFFRVRNIGANAPSPFMILGVGNVGVGTDAPTEKLTVTGMVQSTSGGFKFPDGSVQTTAGAGTYTTNCAASYGFPHLTSSPQPICHLNLPGGTFLITATISFFNYASDHAANNSRPAECGFTGESVVYRNDIAGFSGLTVTLRSILTVTSGGIDVNCSTSLSGIRVELRRLTATQLNGSVVVQ